MNKDVFNQFINHIEFSKFFKYLNIKKENNPENIKKIKVKFIFKNYGAIHQNLRSRSHFASCTENNFPMSAR
ncbi:unnamed protein product [Meloidogyne enterolobii]|uniref:Uncharacterized protein n=1 Tax=Meloidogyne enterolobii TaxID=390850 RepID=A0ACB1A777_MELEN